jgi:MFS family permease
VGTALFTGGLLWLATTWDWRHVFYTTGAVGVVFGVVWLYVYRDPLLCKKVSPEELQYIREGGALVDSPAAYAVQLAAGRRAVSLSAGMGHLHRQVYQHLRIIFFS